MPMIRLMLICCLAIPLIANSQEKTPAKAYRNSADYLNDRPMLETNFIYSRHKSPKYHGSYSVRSTGERIKSKVIHYGIWIISDGDHLYLNGTRQGFIDGYIKIDKGPRYSYFKAEFGLTPDQQERISHSYFLFGIAGASITSSRISKDNRQFSDHVFDANDGSVHELTSRYIQYLLSDYPQMLEGFIALENKDDLEVLKSYLEAINIFEDASPRPMER